MIFVDPSIEQQGQSTASLYDLSYNMNGPLPLYHPRHLLHYLLWGKVDLINTVLLSLLGTLRQVADADVGGPIEMAPPFNLGRILELQNVSYPLYGIGWGGVGGNEKRLYLRLMRSSSLGYQLEIYQQS